MYWGVPQNVLKIPTLHDILRDKLIPIKAGEVEGMWKSCKFLTLVLFPDEQVCWDPCRWSSPSKWNMSRKPRDCKNTPEKELLFTYNGLGLICGAEEHVFRLKVSVTDLLGVEIWYCRSNLKVRVVNKICLWHKKRTWKKWSFASFSFNLVFSII